MSNTRLRELIKVVRSCKTAAEERAVVSKECAAIRTSFKSDDAEYRHRNVAKLLYIHMLGYPSHFGQMECLNLIASRHYPDKRTGYLGLMLLLDERSEVLMLATHSIKSDLHHQNHYIVGLALCAISNISSPEIARDVSPEIKKLLAAANPYLRKKAALAAVRIVRRVPEVLETYIEAVKTLLSERNHGVVLTGISLLLEICKQDEKQIKTFRPMVPQLVRILKSLVMSSYSPDHDVQGITDPFLQVTILRALRVLGKGSKKASGAMNEILASVATNTDNVKNVGNAILYECVQTILAIEAEQGLRVLAINILGRFLLNRDNNIRYVALNTLTLVVAKDIQAVQRHRTTIVTCLKKDTDISIRRRALELIYTIVDKENVQVLIGELLEFLEVVEFEMKRDLVTKICILSEKHAPTKRWHVDTIVQVMTMPGVTINEEILGNFVDLIVRTSNLHAYAVSKMYLALLKNPNNQSLVKVGVWCIGEYGNILISSPDGDLSNQSISEVNVVDLLESLLKNPNTRPRTKEYILLSAMKLTSRFSQQLERLKSILETFKASINLELQQRSCEFINIVSTTGDSLKDSLLEAIPPLDKEEEVEEESQEGSNSSSASSGNSLLALGLGGPMTSNNNTKTSATTTTTTTSGSFSLVEEIFGGSSSTSASSSASSGGSNNSTGASTSSLLGEIFSGASPALPTLTSLTASPSTPSSSSLLAGLGGGARAPPSVGPGSGGIIGGGGLLTGLNLSPSLGSPASSSPLVSSPPSSFGSGGLLPTLLTTTPSILPTNGTNNLVSQTPKYPTVTAFRRNGLVITFDFAKANEVVTVTSKFINETPTAMNDFGFFVAVPPYLELVLHPPSSKIVPANKADTVTQKFTLVRKENQQLAVRIQVRYNIGGNTVTDQDTIVNFPPGL